MTPGRPRPRKPRKPRKPPLTPRKPGPAKPATAQQKKRAELDAALAAVKPRKGRLFPEEPRQDASHAAPEEAVRLPADPPEAAPPESDHPEAIAPETDAEEAIDFNDESVFDPRDLPDPMPLPGEKRPPASMTRWLDEQREARDQAEAEPETHTPAARAASGRRQRQRAAREAMDIREQIGGDRPVKTRPRPRKPRPRKRNGNQPDPPAAEERQDTATRRDRIKAAAEPNRRKARRDERDRRQAGDAGADVEQAVEGGLDRDIAEGIAAVAGDDEDRRRGAMEQAYEQLQSGQMTRDEVLGQIEQERRKSGGNKASAPGGGGAAGAEGVDLDALAERLAMKLVEPLSKAIAANLRLGG